MFTWLKRLLGDSAPGSAEDEAAYQDAQELRSEIETLRLGDSAGPQLFTHGGHESRGDHHSDFT